MARARLHYPRHFTATAETGIGGLPCRKLCVRQGSRPFATPKNLKLSATSQDVETKNFCKLAKAF